MNHSVYAALNGCVFTGLEVEVQSLILPDTRQIKLFRDHGGRHRIVLFTNDAPQSGISGVIINPDGEIYYKETAYEYRGNNYTRQLQAMLTLWNVLWWPSDSQSEAGASCYRNRAV